MAAFTRADPSDRTLAFDAHYERIRNDPSCTLRAIDDDAGSVGTVGSFTMVYLYVVHRGSISALTRNCYGATIVRVPRPYGDPVEIVTAPIPAQSPFIPAEAKIVVGAVAPASPDPIPIVLLPGFEYRMREWRHPDTHEVHWRLERRKAGQSGQEDE